LDSSGKREILQFWREKWSWSKPLDKLVEESNGPSMPWESVRLIGHRGCGKTPRPLY